MTTEKKGHDPAARHAEGATRTYRQLLWSYFWRLKWHYFVLLLSDYAREILRRKYDAIATDRSYENKPSGRLGFIGRAVDRKLLKLPLHEGLRQRLRLVVDDLKQETARQGTAKGPIRILSAPCGLARDVITATTELRAEAPGLASRLDLHGLDLDETGEVLPMAAQRAASAQVSMRFYREDLFNSPSLNKIFAKEGRFHIVNCIGLTAWLDLPDVQRLATYFRESVLMPGGSLIMDNFAFHKHSKMGKDLQMKTRYHDRAALEDTLRRCGFEVVKTESTANGVNMVTVARSASTSSATAATRSRSSSRRTRA
jgi:hypothetical protein